MNQDEINKLLELAGKPRIQVSGDYVDHKHVEYEFTNFGTIESGGVSFASKEEPAKSVSDYTDDVIAKAIIALNGEKKPLCEKQLYVGIIKVLNDVCGWSGKWQTCCDRINDLPLIKATDLEVKCDYNNLKSSIALKFASLDYEEWEDYAPKSSERVIFKKNKTLAKLFEEELDRQIRLLR